jgi:glycosyltransferase involved in cell wall biosynthesis
MGLGIAGEPVHWKGIELWPAATPFMIQKSLQKFKPDVLLHIRDNWVFIPKYYQGPSYPLLQWGHANKTRVFNYTPVQATPLPPEFIETLAVCADMTFLTNQVGIDSVVENGAPKEKLGLMYNGVNAATFRTLNASRHGTGLPEDKKIAIFVGANMDYRKAIPLSMLGFKKYLDKFGDDAALYLHTNPFGGFDLPLFIKMLGLNKRCFLKSAEGMKLMTWDLSTEEMAIMYNMGNAFCTATASEGFNEPALEAFSCGLPVVLTDTPIHREIFSVFGERAHFVKARQEWPTVWAFEHNVDTDDFAEQLHHAFEQGKKEINMKLFPQYNWKRIAQKFLKDIQPTMEQPWITWEEEQKQLEAWTKQFRDNWAAQLKMDPRAIGQAPPQNTDATPGAVKPKEDGQDYT